VFEDDLAVLHEIVSNSSFSDFMIEYEIRLASASSGNTSDHAGPPCVSRDFAVRNVRIRVAELASRQ
jgi:hypothetical protein